MINILYFDNFIKMGPFGSDFGEKMIGNVLGALMRGAYCVEGSCFNLHLVFTVCELGEEGETGEKGDLAALVLKKNLPTLIFHCICFDWRRGWVGGGEGPSMEYRPLCRGMKYMWIKTICI